MASSNLQSTERSVSATRTNETDSSHRRSQVSSLSSNLNFKLPIKLDHTNYNYWRMQVLPAIRAFDLEDFVLNCTRCPEKFVESSIEGSAQTVQVISEEFLLWKKTDQLIVCWLFSTLNESIFGQVTHCTTSFEVWNTLELLFSQQSKARILQIKTEMNATRKGALSINEYVLKMKSFSEALGAAGHHIAVDDLISSVLGGLGPEYDPVVVTITARQSQINLQEVQFLLMSYESRLAQHNAVSAMDLTNASANYSTHNNRGGYRGGYNNQGYRGRTRGRGSGRVGGRTGPRIFCQLCGKSGHVVSSCWHRFDQTFQGT
ncbi:hypothetical protein ACOSQ3_031977 [Xanthoceras sorbifolium]